MGMKAAMVSEPPQPVVICGPSGVGKGTLIGKLMKDFPDKFGFSVSHTTRNPRVKEIDGVHYHFASRAVMAQEIEDGKFLESAEVHGNLYGTSWAAVEAVADAGKVYPHVILLFRFLDLPTRHFFPIRFLAIDCFDVIFVVC